MSAHKKTVSAQEVTLPVDHIIHTIPKLGIIAGIIGLAASVALAFVFGKTRFFGIYLVSYLFFLSISLGGLFFVILQFATRAGWSVTIRRLGEFVMGTFVPKFRNFVIPVMALLFIPVLLGMNSLYHEWIVPTHDAVKAKVGYLNVPFFLVRAAFYFLIWSWIAKWYLSKSLSQDVSGNQDATRKMQYYSYVCIAVFALTLTFSSFDWIMSVDPHWYSTIFGVYMFAGSNMAIYAVLMILIVSFHKMGLLKDVVTLEHQHAVGKMMFGFTVFWAYIAFSQFFLIYYANIPEETKWFVTRYEHGWMPVTYLLAFGHFVVPFFFLMSRHIKKNANLAMGAAIWLLFMHLVDIFWLVIPSLYHHVHPHALHLSIGDGLLLLSTFVGIGGFFVASLFNFMGQNRLVANQDPRLHEALKMENL